MTDCIFCKIAKGEIPCYKLYENENFLAFLDIRPLNKGHTLIIPKEHHRWVWDIETPGEFFEIAAHLANALKKTFGTDFVVSCIVGDEVPHAHIHLIPRFPDDSFKTPIDFSAVKEFPEEKMQQFAEDIKKNI